MLEESHARLLNFLGLQLALVCMFPVQNVHVCAKFKWHSLNKNEWNILQFKPPLQRNEIEWINVVIWLCVCGGVSLIEKAGGPGVAWKVILSKQIPSQKTAKFALCLSGCINTSSLVPPLKKTWCKWSLKIKPRVQVNLNSDQGDKCGNSPTEHSEDCTAGGGQDKGPV